MHNLGTNPPPQKNMRIDPQKQPATCFLHKCLNPRKFYGLRNCSMIPCPPKKTEVFRRFFAMEFIRIYFKGLGTSGRCFWEIEIYAEIRNQKIEPNHQKVRVVLIIFRFFDLNNFFSCLFGSTQNMPNITGIMPNILKKYQAKTEGTDRTGQWRTT